jgi:uncharacterized membrane protein YjgN (DUF898 family)
MTELVQNNRLTFNGSKKDFFILFIKVAFLSVITLGIYSFWGRVEFKKFFYNNTKFQDGTFDFHATGKELFIGFLKGIGILIVVVGVLTLFGVLLSKILGEAFGQALTLIIDYVAIFSVLPFLILASLRFRFSKTTFRGINFGFLGDNKEFAILFLKSIGLTILTFGIYTPWLYANIVNYLSKNTLLGNHAFESKLEGKELLIIFLKGFFLSMLTLGVYSFWLQANVYNYMISHYFFQNGKAYSDLKGGDLFVTVLIGIFLIPLTLGFYTPILILNIRKLYIESITFSTLINFDEIQSVPQIKGSATLDSISDSLGGNLI